MAVTEKKARKQTNKTEHRTQKNSQFFFSSLASRITYHMRTTLGFAGLAEHFRFLDLDLDFDEDNPPVNAMACWVSSSSSSSSRAGPPLFPPCRPPFSPGFFRLLIRIRAGAWVRGFFACRSLSSFATSAPVIAAVAAAGSPMGSPVSDFPSSPPAASAALLLDRQLRDRRSLPV
jgi:hypothetical protein